MARQVVGGNEWQDKVLNGKTRGTEWQDKSTEWQDKMYLMARQEVGGTEGQHNILHLVVVK